MQMIATDAETTASTVTAMMEFIKFVGGLGGVGVMSLFTYAWLKGWIITAREHDRALQEIEWWKQAAWRSLGNNEQQGQTMQQAVDAVGKAAVITAAAGDSTTGAPK